MIPMISWVDPDEMLVGCSSRNTPQGGRTRTLSGGSNGDGVALDYRGMVTLPWVPHLPTRSLMSHSLIVQSQEPEASSWPSGLKATEKTS